MTLNKRKRGIIRKAIEIHDICKQEIYFAIWDKAKNHLVEYKSSDNINLKTLSIISCSRAVTKERYDNDDYEMLSRKFITKEALEAM